VKIRRNKKYDDEKKRIYFGGADGGDGDDGHHDISDDGLAYWCAGEKGRGE
jgi:hypothetical protein